MSSYNSTLHIYFWSFTRSILCTHLPSPSITTSEWHLYHSICGIWSAREGAFPRKRLPRRWWVRICVDGKSIWLASLVRWMFPPQMLTPHLLVSRSGKLCWTFNVKVYTCHVWMTCLLTFLLFVFSLIVSANLMWSMNANMAINEHPRTRGYDVG